ncbi:PorP/SprF family type IX secretion system membrane protein [Flavihumibacter petaseus]|uniref:Type IX secretion system membrane protein PorP/SprF n=1 Tax=Flavihumibacter petaseus NBRC 106054 TaxID=1220578 RepID=A0A0E9MYB7_9BACT|nr:type IX secretion system membrane protein PorP/SprF [Flavihumibacter petaseus]GAO42584.1 hypothetical protein FPE01S_01_15990 [Flavihumibacter petaseus NBRC 106054]
MRKQVFCLLCVAMVLCASGQQKPHYTQYLLNQYIINPALTGIENYIDLKMSHRQQWAGLQDAPVTTYLTVHGALNKKDYRTTATSFDVPGENPRGNSYWESYQAAAPHHGIGLQVINDKTGPINRFNANITYAYHLGLTPKTSLAMGFGAGIFNVSLDASKLDFGNTQVDPAVYGNGNINSIKPDFNAGIYMYSATYFVGLSAQQIIPQTIDFSDNVVAPVDGKTVPHLFATAGYRFGLGDDFNLIPSVMVKYVKPAPVQVDLNAKLQYRDLLWLGTGYRLDDGFNAMVGMHLFNTFNFGYSYDYTITRMNLVSKGTHEIVIGFMLGNKYDDSCPKNIW